METPRLEYTYRETRVDADSTNHQATTISIRLPTVVSSSFSGVKQPRSIVAITQNAEDEKSFRQKHLATYSSVYHRRFYMSPRSFLWRVVENLRVLSIRVVDLSIPKNVVDSYIYTLRFTFPHPISPTCIAFSDSKERDLLSVFVLTDSKQIWTLSLRPDFFSKTSSMDENIMDWCNVYSPRSLGIKTPYRLVALSEDELLISFHDGALARLERAEDKTGSPWKEQQYNEGGWSHSFRSMVPFHSASGIYYEGHYVQPSAATSIASSVKTIDSTTYVFTVTIDHRLRIWNLDTGKIAYSGDILTQELESQDEAKQLIDPSQSRLVQVISNKYVGTLCITYSPISSGEFKLWDVVAESDGSLTLIDLLPNSALIPQAPSSEIWTVADFVVIHDITYEDRISIWVLWKNNVTYQLLKLEFSTKVNTYVQNAWTEDWKAVALDQLRDTPIPKILACDPADVTDKWLEFILYPGRFSTATIETGLAIYEQGLGMEKDISCKSRSLVDRICTSIASTAILARSSDESLDFDQFRGATHTQWMRFYRLLIDLQDQRGEALSLVIDPDGETPWVILADGLSIIRESSHLEKIWHKSTSRIDKIDRVPLLLFAAANFRNSIPETLFFACNSFLREEIYQEPRFTLRARMQQFYERCDFATHIGDEEFEELLRNLNGDFTNITVEVYTAIIELMSPFKDKDRNLSLSQQFSVPTKFGNQIIVKGIQQLVGLYRSICIDQLILLILIENEIINNEDEEERVIQIETAPIYNQLISILSRLELISWLTNTQILLPGIKNSATTTPSSTLSFLKKNSTTAISNEMSIVTNSNAKLKDSHQYTTKLNPETVTIFEGYLGRLFSLDRSTIAKKYDLNLSAYITEILVQISTTTATYHNDLQNGNINNDNDKDDDGQYELCPTAIQCFLLKHDRPDLALDCAMRFVDNDPFPTYILGRVYLAAMELSIAASFFKKAAVGMALSNSSRKKDQQRRSFRYFQSIEYLTESEIKLLFNSGLANYYFHIMTLFQKGQFYSYVTEFAQLSCQFLRAENSHGDENIRKQIHSHLFNAALNTARYDVAYSALALFTNQTLQNTSLRTLITKMCETSNSSYLIELPFVGMQDRVDSILSQKCHDTTNILSGIPYHKILYAWRIKQNNFRGAASILLNRLQRLRQLEKADQIIESHQLETPITQQYISLINTLCCVDPKQAWIFQEAEKSDNQNSMRQGLSSKRQIITLSELRNDYQEELDRLAAIHNNQFQFEGGDAMNIL
ncbi:Nucleoporin NUP120 [Erysiphe neolycopersici]|uniref:Nucleoporin NUP120 n=1 Tax=Erysiphe neolycopersici TaxID=212602 RepID=A0A420HHG9_9PEZI|nr:Nucleoporin NUP120 [Erysiphe neolycopersici]